MIKILSRYKIVFIQYFCTLFAHVLPCSNLYDLITLPGIVFYLLYGT